MSHHTTTAALADPLHLGIDTDATDRVTAADGRVHESLYAIRPVGPQTVVGGHGDPRNPASSDVSFAHHFARRD